MFLKNYLFFLLAAVAEIAGCYAFWAWLRLNRSPVVILPGVVSLIAFAWFLTRIDGDFAGRAYAIYGGIYICASLAWMALVEGQRPDLFDISGGVLCLVGGALILFGPR
jgi:small multidrug resistance family-3 protein